VKKFLILFLMLMFIIMSSACTSSTTAFAENGITSGSEITTEDQTQGIAWQLSTPIQVEFDSKDLDSNISGADLSYILLEGDSITFEGDGAIVTGTVVTIQSAGTYSISGFLNDGQIVVDTQDTEMVKLVLEGLKINSATSAPIYVRNAEKIVLTLVEGTENYVTDAESYLFENQEVDEPNAAIFSNDDLTINGSGSLTVTANYNNGIVSNDDLKITNGNITVNAVNDGIKGNDSIAILDGNISITAGGDGLQSNNDEDIEKGYIAIDSGTFDLTSGLDGIQAETRLAIKGGNFTINAGGGSINTSSSSSAKSAKGIKAGSDLTFTGGTFDINSADDALHSNNSLTIDGGSFVLASGGNGIQANNILTINGGDVIVIQSFEGLESAVIEINEGNIRLVSSDDGLNATTGAGGGNVDSSYFYINGGHVFIDASGDGIDSNGTAVMNGGVVIVQGPVVQNNGPLDVNGDFEVNGGLLIVTGSAGMAETPSTSSSQNSIALVLDSTQPGGTLIHIESEAGEDILTFEPNKDYQLIVFSSPELKANSTYNVYIGGNPTGTVSEGLYTDGINSLGSQVASLEITGIVTTSGSFNQVLGGDGRRTGGRP